MNGIGLVRMQVKDLGVVKEVAVDFVPGINVFQGENGQGKSTLLNAVKFAFEGKRSIPEGIIRRGSDRAEIMVETTDFTVDLQIYDGKNGQTPKLIVKRNGFVKGGPQEFLNGILAEFADPREIALMKPEDVFALLMRYAKIDVSDIEKEIAELREEQTVTRRLIKEAGVLAPVEKAEAVDVSETLAKINSIREANRVEEDKKRAIEMKALKIKGYQEELSRIDESIASLQQEISSIEKRIKEKKESSIPVIDALKLAEQELETMPEPGEIKPTAELEAAISQAEERNRKAALYERFVEWEKKVAGLTERLKSDTERVKELEEQKRLRFTEADMVVEGLRVDEEKGVFYRTVPWKNLSEAEKLMLAAKMIVNTTPPNAVRYMVIHQGESILSKLRSELHEYLVESNFTCLMQVASEQAPAKEPGVFHVVAGEIVGDEPREMPPEVAAEESVAVAVDDDDDCPGM